MPWTTRHPPAQLAVPLIREVYSDNGVGCCLHVVLDDFNTATHFVRWCREWDGHNNGRGICQRCDDCAKVLLLLSETARRKAIRLAGLCP